MEQATLLRQRDELAAIIGRHCPDDGAVETAVPGLRLFRGSTTDAPSCSIMASIFALMVQGAKRITVGDDTYDYDARHCLISSVDLPMFSRITQASASAPYLGLALLIDPLKINELAAAIPQKRMLDAVDRGIAVGTMSAEIQGAALRLTRLLDTPADIPVLAPIIERELLYRLLTSALGSRLRQAAASGSHSHQIVRAIDWLKTNLNQSISIEQLANLANMSKSSLHHHFKALTAMTPLQYQKQMRLHEARRLMLVANADAASAAHHVGYESPSQFNREYRRMFGTPPSRDIAQLRSSQSTR
jgi:AraC-like DNA-binding protein